MLKPSAEKLTVVIETYPSNGWERYADASAFVNSFGKSLPFKKTYEHSGLAPKSIAFRIKVLWKKFREDRIGILRGDFREFNECLRIGLQHSTGLDTDRPTYIGMKLF